MGQGRDKDEIRKGQGRDKEETRGRGGKRKRLEGMLFIKQGEGGYLY